MRRALRTSFWVSGLQRLTSSSTGSSPATFHVSVYLDPRMDDSLARRGRTCTPASTHAARGDLKGRSREACASATKTCGQGVKRGDLKVDAICS